VSKWRSVREPLSMLNQVLKKKKYVLFLSTIEHRTSLSKILLLHSLVREGTPSLGGREQTGDLSRDRQERTAYGAWQLPLVSRRHGQGNTSDPALSPFSKTSRQSFLPSFDFLSNSFVLTPRQENGNSMTLRGGGVSDVSWCEYASISLFVRTPSSSVPPSSLNGPHSLRKVPNSLLS